MKKINYINYIDYLFAFIIIHDTVISGILVYTISTTSDNYHSLGDYFSGWNLVGIVSRVFLHFGLGFATIITLFYHHRSCKWFFLVFVAFIIISGQTSWPLNTDFASSTVIEAMDSTRGQPFETYAIGKVSYELNTHPSPALKIIYFVGLVLLISTIS